MMEKKYKIGGMSCMHCVMAVKKELSKLTLHSSEVGIGYADIKFDESSVSEEQIKAAITAAGYEVVK